MTETKKQEQPSFEATMSFVGYLNSHEQRHKADDESAKFHTVRINVLSGNDGQTFPLNAIVVGEKANKILSEHSEAINDQNTNVIVSGRCEVKGPNAYLNKDEQPAASVDGRLYFINTLKVGGKEVYKTEVKTSGKTEKPTKVDNKTTS